MYSAIVFVLSALLICLICLLFSKKKNDGLFLRFLKIITVVFCTIGLGRFFLSDAFVFVINGATLNGTYYEVTDILQSILRWGYYLNYTILPMAIFFKSRLFKNIASYICLPFSILSTIFFQDFMMYFLSPNGGGLHMFEWFRYLYFVVELALAISIPIIMQIKEKHVFNVKDKYEWIRFLVALPFIWFLLIPPYIPQSLIGYSSMLAEVGSSFHIGWIIVAFILTLALYFIYRFKDYNTRFMLCVFLTLTLFFHYNQIFLMGFSLSRMPVQLCNLAAYLYIIAIPFKRKKLFQFCYLANITGAIIAFVAADFSGGALGFWNMHFVYEHTLVLMVPALAMGLRIFPRLDKKAIKYTFIGFTIYFLFSLSIGTLINGYADVTGVKVNYFFMFDIKKALSYVPFLTFAKDYMWNFGRFEMCPIIVGAIYVAFTLFYILFFALTKYLYKYEDDKIELRKSAIDLYEKRTKKKSSLPRDFHDD